VARRQASLGTPVPRTPTLVAEEYGLKCPTKSYPKRKLLPQFDDEALEPVPSARNAADRPPRGWDKTTTHAEPQPILPHRKGRDITARGYTYDLRQDLESRAGQTRPISRSRGRAPMRDDGYQVEHGKHNHVRAENHRRPPSELHHELTRYRGAAHLLCFPDEVMEHEFPKGSNP